MKFILPGNVTAELANQFKNLIHMSLVVSFQAASASCLCLNEKLEIALYTGDNLLNKRNELVSKYRHVNKHMLTHN